MRKKISILILVLFVGLLTVGGLVNSKAQDELVTLTENNQVTLRGVIDPISSTEVMLKLAELDTKRGQKDYTIYLVLDTPGGSIGAGNDLIAFAKSIKNLKTITIAAYSMGSAIAEALPGERLATENASMMFHRAKGSFEGQFNDGEVESQLAFWKSVVGSMEQVNAERMQLSLKEYKSLVANEYWIYGHDLVSKNAADKIVQVKCSKELIDGRQVIPMNFGLFSVNAIYSTCPLLSNPIKIEE